jgi:hypothetical protein
MADAKANTVEYPRKITLKVIGASPDFEKLLAAEGKRMACADIYGIATKGKPGQSDLGPYVRFLGQFRAVNLATKQVYESPVCILPRFIEEGLWGALGMDGAQQVEFAVRISAKFDKDSATKYVYEARNLLPVKEADALAQLASRVGESVKALTDKSK